ncbi:MAG: sterol desaturase family protein [Nannocystis sp.]|nr:sterol desaturase family protein [Nannocystis sp.]MBA3549980.1 sterol desaturase family protein [Nannocystis sp.]
MLALLLGTTVFLVLMAGLFIPLEGWSPRRAIEVPARTIGLCVGLLFVDVLVMEWIGGAVLDQLAELGPVLEQTSGARIAAALVLAELAGYAIHRLMHRVPWLWRFHAVHHAPTELHWLEAWRQHPVDFVVHGIAVGLPAALLGASLADFAAVVLLRKTYTTFLHANLSWRLRGLERWIATPDYHALHHSHAPQDRDRNFAGMLPVLDRLFGTHAPLRG